MKKFFIVIILLLCGIIGGFFYGRIITKESFNNKTEINSQIILNTLQEQYFVVTKTLFVDENLFITFDTGSKWSNFLWGQELDTDAIVRLDIGVDLQTITSEDISINELTKKINLHIPPASILDSSIHGNLSVKSKDGVLKNIFEDTTSEDYNKAMKFLTEQAEKQISQKEEVFKEAEKSSIKLIELILQNFGYEVEVNEKLRVNSEES